MVALGAGILAAPITRGQSLQVAMVVAGGMNAAAGAVSLYERLQHAEVAATGVALDIITIASGLLNAGGAIRGLASSPGILLANRATKFLLWTNAIADSASAVLIAADGVHQITDIIDNPQLRPEQKREAMIRVVTNLIMAGALLAVSYGQVGELRGKLASILGKAIIASELSEDACLALTLLDDATLHGLRGATAADLAKLARAVRDDPAVRQLARAEHRLAAALPLMATGSADDLRFAILRVRAHEAGVAVANTQRLVTILRSAGISADQAMRWGEKTFVRVASNAQTLDELDKILPFVRSGKITGLDHWLAFGGKKMGDDASRTAGELREARRQSAANPQAQIDIGSDLLAPRTPALPDEVLPSFDMEIKQGGKTLSSVEVGSVEKTIESGPDINPGVGHALKKLESRNVKGAPIPGRHEATVRVTLADRVKQGSAGIIEIAPNGDRVRITRQAPPVRKPMRNIFDEFVDGMNKKPEYGALDRVNIVDANSGSLLAQCENAGGTWKRVH